MVDRCASACSRHRFSRDGGDDAAGARDMRGKRCRGGPLTGGRLCRRTVRLGEVAFLAPGRRRQELARARAGATDASAYRAMEKDVAVTILIEGMRAGTFAGRALGLHFSEGKADWVGAHARVFRAGLEAEQSEDVSQA